MKRTILALATAATLAPAASFAQSELVTPALSMLELSVTRALAAKGVEGVDMASLTLADLAVIKGILDSDDSDGQKKAQIERIVNK